MHDVLPIVSDLVTTISAIYSRALRIHSEMKEKEAETT